MRQFLVVLLLASPAMAEDAAPGESSMMERGLKLFMDGLVQEMEPALRDLEDLAEEAGPMFQQFQDSLGSALTDLDVYHPPEILPNGDIIIRRKEPLLPDGVEPNPDGSFDL